MNKEQIEQKAKNVYMRCFDDDFEYTGVLHALEICAEETATEATRELEAQIERMKNCKNCNKLKKEKDGLLVCTVGSFYTNVFGKNCDKWEIKENE